MTSFQVITIVIALLTLAGGMITAYIRLKTDIAKLQADIAASKNSQNRLNDEKADHNLVMSLQKETNSKLDHMSNQINIIVTRLMK